jgi:hypothetical protein
MLQSRWWARRIGRAEFDSWPTRDLVSPPSRASVAPAPQPLSPKAGATQGDGAEQLQEFTSCWRWPT